MIQKQSDLLLENILKIYQIKEKMSIFFCLFVLSYAL